MMTVERQLERAIIDLLDKRADGATVSPAEAARRIGGPRWRSLEAPARRAAHNLSVAGQVTISQNGSTVDAMTVKGPIRIRSARPRF
jgi:hypothetical protein